MQYISITSLTRGTRQWCRAALAGAMYAKTGLRSQDIEHRCLKLKYPSCVQSCTLMSSTCILQAAPGPFLICFLNKCDVHKFESLQSAVALSAVSLALLVSQVTCMLCNTHLAALLRSVVCCWHDR